MHFLKMIATAMMMMSIHHLLPVTASGAAGVELSKEGITDEVRARMMKVHEKAKRIEREMSSMEHRGKLLDLQFAKEVINPVSDKGNGEAGENNRLLQEFVTAPAACEDSDPEFDGVICVILGYPGSGFNVALIGCPSNTESTRDFFFCGGCLVYAGDFDNEDFCSTCTLCSDNDIGFDCDNVATGDCVAYDCTTGICSSVGGQPSGNPPPPPPPPPTPFPTPFPPPPPPPPTPFPTNFPTPFPTNPPFSNPPPPPPPTTPQNPPPFGNPPVAQIGNNPTPTGNSPTPFGNANPGAPFAPFGNPGPFEKLPTSGAIASIYHSISLSFLGATAALMMVFL